MARESAGRVLRCLHLPLPVSTLRKFALEIRVRKFEFKLKRFHA